MFHCGFVGIVGLPNTGKSTFLNKILGEKISIVSSKPQTTRRSLTGLVSRERYQLIFLDAPGFVRAKPGLFEFLFHEMERVIKKSEQLLVLISHDQKENSSFKTFMNLVEESKKPMSFLFTKTDLQESDLVSSLKKKSQGSQVLTGEFSIKEKKLDPSVDQLLEQIALRLPATPHPLYDPEIISLDQTRDIMGEFIREQCFIQLDQEIPFGLGVVIKEFKREKGLQHIQANILVAKENHKAILIGKGGRRLKSIGQEARKNMENLLGEKLFLGLHVTHKKNWMGRQKIMKELGYDHGRN